MRTAARLIINADDCGYLPEVTRGIGAAIDAGVVTATGVLANGAGFEQACALLAGSLRADAGVHLNLSWGSPLSGSMAQRLAQRGGRFPAPALLVRDLATGRLPIAVVEDEWRAQVERVRGAGLPIAFLNTHQHVHLWPPLRRLVLRLAADYRVGWVRRLEPEWRESRTPAGFARGAVVTLLQALPPRPAGRGAARRDPLAIPCAGLGPSGRLDVGYLVRLVARLAPGSRTELMCHPGYADPSAPPPLRGYHAWEQELAALCSAEFREACERHRVVLSRYSAL